MSIIIITSITINIGCDSYIQYYQFYVGLSGENYNYFLQEAEDIPCQNREDINKLCFSY